MAASIGDLMGAIDALSGFAGKGGLPLPAGAAKPVSKAAGYLNKALAAAAGVALSEAIAGQKSLNDTEAMYHNMGWRPGIVCSIGQPGVVDQRASPPTGEVCLINQPWDQLIGAFIPATWLALMTGRQNLPTFPTRMVDQQYFYRPAAATAPVEAPVSRPVGVPRAGARDSRPWGRAAQGPFVGIGIFQSYAVQSSIPMKYRASRATAPALSVGEQRQVGNRLPIRLAWARGRTSTTGRRRVASGVGSVALPGARPITRPVALPPSAIPVDDLIVPLGRGFVVTRGQGVHQLARAQPMERENKINATPRGLAVLRSVFGHVTESIDVLDALYNALPARYQRAHSLQGRITALTSRWREIDWTEAVFNIADAQVQDALAAQKAQGLQGVNRASGIAGGPYSPLGFGPLGG